MVKATLVETKRGCFDPDFVRALLNCTSLFPIGSNVKLSDDRITTVMRSNPGQHTKPVVVPNFWSGVDSDQEIDLAKTDSIKVVIAIGASGSIVAV